MSYTIQKITSVYSDKMNRGILQSRIVFDNHGTGVFTRVEELNDGWKNVEYHTRSGRRRNNFKRLREKRIEELTGNRNYDEYY